MSEIILLVEVIIAILKMLACNYDYLKFVHFSLIKSKQ